MTDGETLVATVVPPRVEEEPEPVVAEGEELEGEEGAEGAEGEGGRRGRRRPRRGRGERPRPARRADRRPDSLIGAIRGRQSPMRACTSARIASKSASST